MRTLASLALSLLLTSIASADVITAQYNGPSQFSYEIIHLPDFDQRRSPGGGAFGFPGDGSMYCVPTSSMNMLAYIAAHGFPQVSPGIADWWSPSTYNLAGLEIIDLAQDMGTSATGGTDGGGWFEGLSDWLGPHDSFVIGKFGASGNYSPRVKDIALSGINGHLVSFGFGRFKQNGTFQGIEKMTRDGGHVVTLSKAKATGASEQLWSRDPADDPDDGMYWTQSVFGNTEYEVDTQVLAFGSSIHQVRVVSVLDEDPSEDFVAIIDGYVSIRPKTGYSFVDTGTHIELLQYAPFAFLGSAVDPQEVLSAAALDKVFDVALDPDGNGYYVLGEVAAKTGVHHVDLQTGGFELVVEIPGATDLTVGRNRNLYATSGTKVFCVDPYDVDVKAVQVKVPLPCDDLVYDDSTDTVLLLSAASSGIVRVASDLTGVPEVLPLPATVQLMGDGVLAWNPMDGTVCVMGDQSSHVFHLSMPADVGGPPPALLEAVPSPTGALPTSVDFDDAGSLFIAAGGKVRELHIVDGKWQVEAGSVWEGLQVGPLFGVARSRTNFDPATMTGPAYRNLDADELAGLAGHKFIPDCESKATDVEYGAGKAGSFGVPTLKGGDPAQLGSVASIEIGNALPGAPPLLLIGASQAALPFDGGTLLVQPQLVLPIPIPVAGDGTLTLSGPIPADVALCGAVLYHQVLYHDPGAVGFYQVALTNGLARTIGS